MRRWIPGLVLVALLSGASLRASGQGIGEEEEWCIEPDEADGEPHCPAVEEVREEAERDGAPGCEVTEMNGGLLYEDRGCCYAVQRFCRGGCY